VSRATTIPLTSVLVLWGLTIMAAAEIPGDVRSTANTWAFLASMGQRCETRLQVYGYAGVHDEVCRDFEDQFTRINAELRAKKEVFLDAARAADATQSLAVRMEWTFFLQGFHDSQAQVFKTMEHILFLRQNEIDRKKKPERGKR
jgi:uncharacterized protein (DUF2164 family)